jgi:2-deoxy-D-gluconate 3-dehydrogenase
MLDLFNLNGKVAVVTGANRGIGQAIAVGLAKAGADIVIVGRKNLDETEKLINQTGKKCVKIYADLFDLNNAKNLIINGTLKEFGRLDILVNNAGIQRRNPALVFTEKDWDDVILVNLKSVFILSQAAAAIMKENGWGKIINMASMLSFQGGITVPAYAASKGGVAQLTKALANEWARYGINVNAIAPGYIDTEMNKSLIADEIRNRQILERIPAGRWGEPEDLVGGAIFLASHASDYVNGHILCIDGGWLSR